MAIQRIAWERTFAGSNLADDWPEEVPMLDLLFVALTVGFFALSWAYVRACDRV
jgi:hypothetical protein